MGVNRSRPSWANSSSTVSLHSYVKVRSAGCEPQWEVVGGGPGHGHRLALVLVRWHPEECQGLPLQLQLLHYSSRYASVHEALKKPDGVVVVTKYFQVKVLLRGHLTVQQILVLMYIDTNRY